MTLQPIPLTLTASDRTLLAKACTVAVLYYLDAVLRGLDESDLDPFLKAEPDYEPDDEVPIVYDDAAAHVYARIDDLEALAERLKVATPEECKAQQEREEEGKILLGTMLRDLRDCGWIEEQIEAAFGKAFDWQKQNLNL